MVPVAIDQAYQRRQKDTEGEFYRSIVKQRPRFKDFNRTTQGFYLTDSSGKLLFYNNNRDPEKLLRLLTQGLEEFLAAPPHSQQAIEVESRDPRWNVGPPAGGLVVRVRAKVLGGYESTDNRWTKIFQSALSRDNLWITSEEHQRLVAGDFPASLQRRIAKFHLVDNTRGEPPMWRPADIQNLDIQLSASGHLQGSVLLENETQSRGYQANLMGEIDTEDGKVTKFQMVCLGEFWGKGRYTPGAPQGKFPLAIAFTLADGNDIADRVPPQGSRGWIEGYLE